MKLYLFEGKKREPKIFHTIEQLFFESSEDYIVCSYGNNLYSLYSEIKENNDNFELDTVSFLREHFKNSKDSPFKDIDDISIISEVYLFFDLDCHNQNLDKTINFKDLLKKCEELLSYFNEETEHGKLYINYPMVESLFYTKKLPDDNYHTYSISLNTYLFGSDTFKKITSDFMGYGNYDFALLKNKKESPNHTAVDTNTIDSIRENWKFLIKQNVEKANLVCTGKKDYPNSLDDISQNKIFEINRDEYINKRKSIIILNSFPLYIYEFIRRDLLLLK